MSMSQEEIESLMNGLDFDSDEETSENVETEEESTTTMSEEDINKLIAQTEEALDDEEESVDTEESVDELLSSIENSQHSEDESDETDIDDILKELEQDNSLDEEPSSVSEDILDEIQSMDASQSEESFSADDDIDALLSSIDNVKEEETKPATTTRNDKEIDDLDYKINSGVFPLPVEEDTKVVNQLSAVASDSEEKATKIFDVLSNILDYNNSIQADVKALSSFNERQVAMLSSLTKKFPNIVAFKENLDQAQKMGVYISDANEKLNDGNTEIFQAMELMQYHDINRQKIERVMAVIRKLSSYLNNLFEDQGAHKEIAVAKHIHGDSNGDLMATDDLEALIAEFNK